ncbi:MAG: hypothetical protein K6343_06595 [Caldisericaceae bacterium]
MNFVNVAEEQMNENTEKAFKDHEDFFSEYFSTFESREQFEMNINSILENNDPYLTRANIDLLTRRLSLLPSLINRIKEDLVIPDVIFLIGLNNFDGHGLIINRKPYIFLNMTRMNEILKNKSFTIDVHLLHEMFHAIHYFYSPSFYIKSYSSIEHQYLKRMIAEGVATYFSKYAVEAKFEEALWVGLIGKKHFDEWLENSKEKKGLIWNSIRKAISTSNFDVSLNNTLFAISGLRPEDLIKGRLGYYYGLEIVKKACKEGGITKILSLDYDKFKKYAEQYFLE